MRVMSAEYDRVGALVGWSGGWGEAAGSWLLYKDFSRAFARAGTRLYLYSML